jgi:hypothetical protein
MFKPKFETEQDLLDYLNNLDTNQIPIAIAQCREGVYISSQLRSEILTGPNQGRCIINGVERSFGFTDRKDGVYQVYVH